MYQNLTRWHWGKAASTGSRSDPCTGNEDSRELCVELKMNIIKISQQCEEQPYYDLEQQNKSIPKHSHAHLQAQNSQSATTSLPPAMDVSSARSH